MESVVCVFDLDNTLYDFIDFFGPAFRGMIYAVSKSTNIDKDILIENAKEVIANRGYTEYAFLIREMRIFRDCSSEELTEIERIASGSFSRVRNKRLKPYPHVNETIHKLFEGGVQIAAVTNAPLYQAYRRLEALRLIKYFSLVVAVDNSHIPENVRLKGNAEPWLKNKKLTTITFNRSLGKPNNHAYKMVIETFPGSAEYWVLGDNIGRDLEPAALLGYKTMWAKYGCDVDQKNYQTVLQLTPEEIKKHEVAVSDYKPDYVVDDIVELLDLIPRKEQLDLFD